MTATSDIVAGARTLLRDYPMYFEIDEGPLNVLTIRLPHPLIAPSTVQVYVTTEGTPGPPPVPAVTTITTEWQLDERNGLLKLLTTDPLGKSVIVSGYHYTWFADADLIFHAKKVINEMTYSGTDLDCFLPAQLDVIMLGAVVHALWSLAMELSLDIDVSTPEGMFIPARQRFAQVMQMIQYYEAQYQQKAAMLNMGLNAIEQFRLRRVAYLTGRYVPVYQEREFDDPTPPDRLYPAIPAGVPPSAEQDEDVIGAITAGSVIYHQDMIEE